MDLEQNVRDLDRAAVASPYPYKQPLPPARRDAHLHRLGQFRGRYFAWGWGVLTPGIVLFVVAGHGLQGRSVFFGTDRGLAGVWFLAGAGLLAIGLTGLLRAVRRMREHHHLLVFYGMPPERTGLIVPPGPARR